MVRYVNQAIQQIFYGKMGIKQIKYGTKTIYERKGAYFYLEFDSSYGEPETKTQEDKE